MNYLFLDVDGVIRLDKEKEFPLFNKESLFNLKLIFLMTNCKIILTSDWKNDSKKLKNLQRVLKIFNLEITDIVAGKYENRGKNIKNYLENHYCDNYLVLDDDIDIIKNEIDEKHYVITHSAYGITKEIKEEVIKKLGDKYDLDNRIRR